MFLNPRCMKSIKYIVLKTHWDSYSFLAMTFQCSKLFFAVRSKYRSPMLMKRTLQTAKTPVSFALFVSAHAFCTLRPSQSFINFLKFSQNAERKRSGTFCCLAKWWRNKRNLVPEEQVRNSKGKKKARNFFLGTFPFHHISPVRLNYSYLLYGLLGRVKVNKIQHCNWLPERARWRCVARSRLQRCSLRKMFLWCSLSRVINLLLTNLIRQEMAGYRPRIGRSKNKKTRK